jgi:hypothetical protein
MSSPETQTQSQEPVLLEFQEYVVQRDKEGTYRKCPYCGQKVWDGPNNTRAPGFRFHLGTKILAHSEKPEWVAKYGKDSWHLGTQADK